MFSGIIEEVGVVAEAEPPRMRIRAERILADLLIGDSVAVNGACLTLTAVEPGTFSVEVSPETVARTTLASLRPGTPVNLERALRMDARLGGHFVQGHVDGIGVVESMERQGDFAMLTVQLPPSLIRYCVEKGSLAIDGISLTIAAFQQDRVQVSLVPHTLKAASAGAYRTGTRVNVEVDLVAKLVAAQLERYRAAVSP